MDNIKFADDIVDINIIREKENKTEKKNTDRKENTDTSSIILDTFKIDNDTAAIETPKRGIGVLKTAEIKTNNSLINITQHKVRQEQKQEENRIKTADIEFPYLKNNLLTGAETTLFKFMEENLCQVERIHIFPKVRLADIIQVDNKITTDKSYLWKITNKHVDFLLCKKSDMSIICVVELDDYTHETQEAQDRDIFVMQALYAANIRTARIRCKISTIDINDLRLVDSYINEALAPNCPDCGLPMIPRQDRKGHRFYACSDNRNCRKTISIDSQGEKLP